jgi:proteasome accessory factor B
VQSVVERVINLLIYLLESPGPVTAEQIRHTVAGYGEQRDEAFHRMFERDKDLLKRLGIPVELKAMDVWEVDHGYTVDAEKYALPDPGLTDRERVALSVAARMVRLGGSNAGLAGLLKLGGVDRDIGVEPLGADLGAETGVLGDLFLAVTERRHIQFTYGESRRDLDPYGIAHQRGHWYLVGHTSQGERVFRVDRMSEVTVGKDADAFSRPKRFNVRRAMSVHPWETGGGHPTPARVKFAPEVAWWAARILGMQAPTDGPFEVELPVANRDSFIGWILSFGTDAEVLGPDDLRGQTRERIEAAMAGAR